MNDDPVVPLDEQTVAGTAISRRTSLRSLALGGVVVATTAEPVRPALVVSNQPRAVPKYGTSLPILPDLAGFHGSTDETLPNGSWIRPSGVPDAAPVMRGLPVASASRRSKEVPR